MCSTFLKTPEYVCTKNWLKNSLKGLKMPKFGQNEAQIDADDKMSVVLIFFDAKS